MSLNTIRAILLINAKKGWTEEARKKALEVRKRKAKVNPAETRDEMHKRWADQSAARKAAKVELDNPKDLTSARKRFYTKPKSSYDPAAKRSSMQKASGYLERRQKTLGKETSEALKQSSTASNSRGTTEEKHLRHQKAQDAHQAAFDHHNSKKNFTEAAAHEQLIRHHKEQKGMHKYVSKRKVETAKGRKASAATDRQRAKAKQGDIAAMLAQHGIKGPPPKITAKQEGGDDGYQYVIRVDGREFINGLTRSELDHYKSKALESWIQRKKGGQ